MMAVMMFYPLSGSDCGPLNSLPAASFWISSGIRGSSTSTEGAWLPILTLICSEVLTWDQVETRETLGRLIVRMGILTEVGWS